MQQYPVEELLSRYVRTRDVTACAEIIARHEGLVQTLARQFSGRGVAREDLEQCARVALLGAVRRFDPSRGSRFSTYAVECIVGEIKRHFRDHSSGIRFPRRLQQLALRIPQVEERLQRELGREPSVPEVASALGETEEEVLEAMELPQALHPLPLDHQPDSPLEARVEARLAVSDPALDAVVDRVAIHEALAALDDRDRSVLAMRYFDGRSQHEVGQQIGTSQVWVSKLEVRALSRLRSVLAGNC